MAYCPAPSRLGSDVTFGIGDVVALREIYDGRIWAARPWTVVRDDDELLVLWISPGAVCRMPALPDGKRIRLPRDRWILVDEIWESDGVLRIREPGCAHSVIPIVRGGAFEGWYVNMEEPFRRTPIGFDHLDQVLDLVIRPDGSFWWKDEDELDEAVRRGVLTDVEAREIRDEGERVLAQYEIGASPFRDGWEDWRPDPAWPVPALPDGWDAA